ncbi:MAG: serine/threonine-protein kinase [Cyanobacteria bacterium P01_A01_bin.123]
MHYCLNPECTAPVNSNESPVCQTCNTPLLLNNRYTAIKLLGQGGFGRTFLAIDTSLTVQRSCVIKQLFQSTKLHHSSEKVIDLFQQEARQLEKLGQHAHIPSLFDHFEQDGHQYLIQEFIDGQDLRQELKQGKTYSQRRILQLLSKVLPTLNFIHQNKVIHRDIKPANIICRKKDYELFLVDLGAAKQATETALVKTGTVIGSAEYTAPEQAKGKAAFASDIYGLGTTCLHLMTNMSPFDLFDSGTYAWVWRDYLTSSVDDDFARIIDKMIQPATNHRYQSVAELLADLERFLAESEDLSSSQSVANPSKLKSSASTQPVFLSQFRGNESAKWNQTEQDSIPSTSLPFVEANTFPAVGISSLQLQTQEPVEAIAKDSRGLPQKNKNKALTFFLLALPIALILGFLGVLFTTNSTLESDPLLGQEGLGEEALGGQELSNSPNTTPDPIQNRILNIQTSHLPRQQLSVIQHSQNISVEEEYLFGDIEVAWSDLKLGDPAIEALLYDYAITSGKDFAVLVYDPQICTFGYVPEYYSPMDTAIFYLQYCPTDPKLYQEISNEDLAIGGFQFWNIDSKELAFHFAGRRAFIRNESYQIGYVDTNDFKVKLHDFRTGEYIQELGAVDDASFSVPLAVSPNEEHLITVTYHNSFEQNYRGEPSSAQQQIEVSPYFGSIQVWNLNSGNLEQTISDHDAEDKTPEITFSEDGKEAIITSTSDSSYGDEIAVIELP